METKLLQQDRRPWLVVEPSALRTAFLYLVDHLANANRVTFIQGDKDRWVDRRNTSGERWEAEFGRVVIEYDADEDGEGDSSTSAVGTIFGGGGWQGGYY